MSTPRRISVPGRSLSKRRKKAPIDPTTGGRPVPSGKTPFRNPGRRPAPSGAPGPTPGKPDGASARQEAVRTLSRMRNSQVSSASTQGERKYAEGIRRRTQGRRRRGATGNWSRFVTGK